MALTWTGEDEVDTVVATWEATAALAADDPEAPLLALISAANEAIFQAQNSGNTRLRFAELLVDSGGARCAPVFAQFLANWAAISHVIRNELGKVASGPTAAENQAAYEGDAYSVANLQPVH